MIQNWNSKSCCCSMQSKSWPLRRWGRYWQPSEILSPMLPSKELIGTIQAISEPKKYASLNERMGTERSHPRTSSSWWPTSTWMVTANWTITTSCRSSCRVTTRTCDPLPRRDQTRSCIQTSSSQWESRGPWVNWFIRKSNYIWKQRISRDRWNPATISAWGRHSGL